MKVSDLDGFTGDFHQTLKKKKKKNLSKIYLRKYKQM